MEKRYKNSYKTDQKELVSLSVYNVGCQRCEPNYQWGPGIRDHYLIHYIMGGHGVYDVAGQKYDLSAGDCFLVYPNTEVTYRADEEDPWEYAWVGFSGSDAAMLLKATDFTRDTPCLRQVEYGEDLEHRLLHIYDGRGGALENAVEMTGRLYTALALFIQNSRNNQPQNSTQTYVRKSIEYITANYSYPITVESIASYVGLSRSHLFRSFQTILGMSPKEYLSDFRIRQACYLLEHSSLSVTAIANSVGFENSLYFSKTFHKRKGLSPREYRTAHTQT